jgi:ribosomal protein S19E (S16A)
VPEVWKEYKHGINGHMSVYNLNLAYGSAWRRESAERKYYSKRNLIYKKILEAINSGSNENEAVGELEELRLRKKISLDGLQKYIKDENI